MANVVDYVTNTLNAKIVLDPHNYARYYGNIIGTRLKNIFVKISLIFF